jgi:hypothetical protein
MDLNTIPRDLRDNPSGLKRRAIFIAGKEGVSVDEGERARRIVNLNDAHNELYKAKK